jgi:hypothetical protein
MSKGNFVKVLFELEQDDEGFPPITVETLWCKTVRGRLIVDNTPVFASGVSCGDEIAAIEKQGRRVFEKVVNASGNSSVMVFSEVESVRRELCKQLRQMNCVTEEGSQVFAPFVAVNIPQAIAYGPVKLLLEKGQAEEKWVFVENAVRHSN